MLIMSVASRFFYGRGGATAYRTGLEEHITATAYSTGLEELIGATAYRTGGVDGRQFLLKKRKISLKVCLLRKIVITLLVDTKYDETVTGHINVDARAGNGEYFSGRDSMA